MKGRGSGSNSQSSLSRANTDNSSSSTVNGDNLRSDEEERRVSQILKQAHDFEIALQAMDYVLDDRTEKGLALLCEQMEPSASSTEFRKDNCDDQTITTLAQGVIEFLQATLSFEADEMKRAAVTLGRAENLSWKSKQNAERAGLRSSNIYPPGTVYAVTYTESLLLHALLMLFSESMMEAAKALLKLKKAYSMLQEIMESVNKAEAQRKRLSSNSGSTLDRSNSSENNLTVNRGRSSSNASFVSEDGSFVSLDIPYQLTPKQQENRKLWSFAEKVHKMRMRRISGAHIGNTPAVNRMRDDLGMDAINKTASREDLNFVDEEAQIREDIGSSQATIDEFIYSGVNLCYGILQVVLSLIPPAIGAVLSIVGFRGSREDGLRLIWKSTRERNVHGCIGLLSLMFYYDGPFQFTDVDFDIPPVNSAVNSSSTNTNDGLDKYLEVEEMDSNTLLHPGKMLEASLLKSRALFPNSALWLLNEARMLAGKGRLREAVDLLDSIDTESIQMRQVKTLLVFDRAITLVNMHEFERAANDLIYLIDVSDWSHALYTYFAGACYLEKWRMCDIGIIENDPRKDFYKSKAQELIFGAPALLGKKTFRSKNLPLDRFMLRKVEQFKATQIRLGLKDPIDAIATSPVHELAYFYNGYNRMTLEDLQVTEKMLSEYKNPAIEAKNIDQELIKNLLLSLTYRRIGQVQKGVDLLDNKVLPNIVQIQGGGKVKYIKKNEDPWAYPTALYERALFCWKIKGVEGLQECRDWLTKAQNYAADYELSTRVGMKIKAALDRVESSIV